MTDLIAHRSARGPGRPYNKSTRLGQRMHQTGMSVGQVAAQSVMSERKLSNFLANRRTPSIQDMQFLAAALSCDVRDIAEPNWPGYLG